MKPLTLTVDDILSIMNSTINPDLLKRCKREIKNEIGVTPMFDTYICKWILVG